MDVAAIASALIASRTAQAQIAVAGKMLRMNAQSAQSVAQLLDAAAQNGARAAAAMSGVGGVLDIMV
jgi:hypothetical protein